MPRENVRDLEERREAGLDQPTRVAEWERLSRRLYALVSEWEELIPLQRELERQFIEGDLRVQQGPRRGQALLAPGRRRRLKELLEVHTRVRQLREAIDWTELRRLHVQRRLWRRSQAQPSA